jgi:class 3 adenylate cyclase
MKRRLAAILAADVVGYSRLMDADEVDTFERLRLHRKELFEPEIEKHHGRIFKLMGDPLGSRWMRFRWITVGEPCSSLMSNENSPFC